MVPMGNNRIGMVSSINFQRSPNPMPPEVERERGARMSETARYGHHPDPVIDFCTEVDALEGMKADINAGFDDEAEFSRRLSYALDFVPGADERAVVAKNRLRVLAGIKSA
jgi:uncharacterized protein with von Willebrand factor type A (vWA) domain